MTRLFGTRAKDNDFMIVSKDADMHDLSLVFGNPPKVVWLRVGNCKVKLIKNLLRRYSVAIHTFELDKVKSFLPLP